MKSKKTRRLTERTRNSLPVERAVAEVPEAPGFLVRLVGKNRAKTLCRSEAVVPRPD